MSIHKLKTWPEPFQAIQDGVKPWEFRKDDRGFSEGDVLILEEYKLEPEGYTGKIITRIVTYILRGPQFGIPKGYCIMTLEK